MKKIKLFCFPFAGGSASVFNKCQKFADKRIIFIPIELKGRGRRRNEPFYNSFDEAIDDLFNQIMMELDGSPFALFGYSMGSIIAYELAYKMKEMNYPLPLHLIVSVHNAPHIKKIAGREAHLLPDDLFFDEIANLGGIPQALFESKGLRQFFIKILKNDLRIHEEYQFNRKNERLNCDISVLYAKEDNVASIDKLHEWEKHTSKHCYMYEFDGGHFFINEETQAMVASINNILVDKK